MKCQPKVIIEEPKQRDFCSTNPCGLNTECNSLSHECRCIAEYQGNPYEPNGCRPECSNNVECARNRACLRNKCVDPCIGTCGVQAICEVVNHIPVCSCESGFTGDPFSLCRPEEKQIDVDVCNPSPCGVSRNSIHINSRHFFQNNFKLNAIFISHPQSNAKCRDISDHAVCSCLPGFIGSPPQCRPECISSSECAPTLACVNQKCVDPCAGTCGVGARCEVISHSPICSCNPGETGDPFRSCQPLPIPPPIEKDDPCVLNPCQESCNPCGPNSQCRAFGETPSCQCNSGYIGSPPNCRPECVLNADCPTQLACINNKCQNPCEGSCGAGAECHVIGHTVSCVCPPPYTGNPFVQCIIEQQQPINPCEPSPCSSNAECIHRNGVGACRCIEGYHGNPYEGCRPECVLSSDCPADKACIRNKCENPCKSVCGLGAECKFRHSNKIIIFIHLTNYFEFLFH